MAPSFSRNFMLAALGAGLVIMLAVSLMHIIPVSTEVRTRGMAPEADGAAQQSAEATGPEFALSDEQMAEVSELMGKLKDNPNDAETLTAIGSTFLSAKDWNRAEFFLGRAVLSRPAHIKSRYMLGIAQYRLGKLPEAVKSFEELLAIEEDPSTLYNLGIIYKYQANNQQRAQELFNKLIASDTADPDVVEKARKELE